VRAGISAAAIAAVLCVVPVPASAAGAHVATPSRAAPLAMVDVRSGSLGPGFVAVAAGVPFGMVTPGPITTTPVGDDPLNYVGYAYQDSEIRGFALTHFSGAGIHIGGELPVMPTTGAVTSMKPSDWASPFTHATETAQPGYYATTLLKTGIRAELTAATRTAVERFTFPAGSQGNLLFDVTRNNDSNQSGGTLSGGFRVVGDRAVRGFVVVPDSGGVTIWFAARFDRRFEQHGTWTASGMTPARRSAHGHGAGGWVGFDTSRVHQVEAQIALSYTSQRQATRNLAAEVRPGQAFDTVRAQAQGSWDARLRSITVDGGTRRAQRTFYTAMYHALLMPTVFDDVDGRYRGFDDKIRRVRRGHHHYTDLSLWDTYRTQTPLLTLIAPRVAHDLGSSILADTDQNAGVIPRWVRANRDYGIMGGDSGTPTLATLVTSGALRGAAARKAYRAVLRQARTLPPVAPRSGLDSYLRLGYIPIDVSDRGAAVTLEYAIDDAAVAGLARRFHDRRRAAQFTRRAGSWRHLMDRKDGFLRPRMSNGSWAEPTNLGLIHVWNPIFSDGWQEGTGWQYLWLVPQDVRGLAQALGKSRMLKRLDQFFVAVVNPQLAPVVPEVQTQASLFGTYYVGNQYTPANETDLQAPWLYNWLGQPWRTQQIVRAETEVFNPSPYGLPGNDDAGTMSAAYVLSAIGLYQAQPGFDAWELSSPLFPTVRIRRGLTIAAPGSGQLRQYIGSATLNGHAFDRAWLRYRDLHGVLRYEMSPRPTKWGSRPEAAPPSLSDRR
jgi:predicted alpha-1,2-mannosidase